MKSKNKVARAITEACKEKSVVLCSIRMPKNTKSKTKKGGQFSSIEGTISGIEVNADGVPYVVIKPQRKDRHPQNVHLDNVLAVVKDGTLYKR